MLASPTTHGSLTSGDARRVKTDLQGESCMHPHGSDSRRAAVERDCRTRSSRACALCYVTSCETSSDKPLQEHSPSFATRAERLARFWLRTMGTKRCGFPHLCYTHHPSHIHLNHWNIASQSESASAPQTLIIQVPRPAAVAIKLHRRLWIAILHLLTSSIHFYESRCRHLDLHDVGRLSIGTSILCLIPTERDNSDFKLT